MNAQFCPSALKDSPVNEFLEKYNDAIIQSCRKCHLQHADTDAVYSEVINKFFVTGKAKIDPSKENPEGYVRRIATNCAKDIGRSRRKDVIDLDDPDMPEFPDPMADFIHAMDVKELGRILDESFRILAEKSSSERDFSVFRKSFLEKEKREKIAKEYNISPYDVSVIQFRLKRKLREIVAALLTERGWELPR